jgi:type IV pilus assembly protein PilW
MKRLSAGFGLIEIMLSLVLGLLISLALTQALLASKGTYLSQVSSANLQEDARFVLGKIVQEARMAGMFGCLSVVDDSSNNGGFSSARKRPVQWDAGKQSLALFTTGAGLESVGHTWMLQTDCATSAKAYTRGKAPGLAAGDLAFPVHKQVYQFRKDQAELTINSQPLLSNVSRFEVMFGVADNALDPGVSRYESNPDPDLIRSIHLTLTLIDPSSRVQEQTFYVVAALRNRLG